MLRVIVEDKDTGERLAGNGLTLTNDVIMEALYLETDDSGEWFIENLPIGNYTLEDSSPAAAYQTVFPKKLKSNQELIYTIKKGKITIRVDLIVQTVDDGNPALMIGNIGFKLYKKHGGFVQNIITSTGGEVRVINLNKVVTT